MTDRGGSLNPRASLVSRESWARVEAILDEVLERRTSEWAALLDRACSGDFALRNEVQSLLDRHPRVEQFLHVPALEIVGTVAAPGTTGTFAAGAEIAGYRIVREIGRGGMGCVLLADRAGADFEQRVALKVLHSGADNREEVLRRFAAERRILAGLDHPSITRLIDGGVTDEGRSYLVMELVAGEPIDVYCDRRRLSVRERLRLLLGVIEAVHHAHSHLVVHRDLKPSNIHVTADGHVKLLDFGIAKLIDSATADMADSTTRTAWRFMTPAYAAPEQIRGETVTTATDVYQLGVVLYELVCGRRPFGDDVTRPYRIERAVLENEPKRPSSTIARWTTRPAPPRGSSELGRLARSRSTTPQRLRRALRGDLDAIILRALRKEPASRYGSAHAFAADIERYLTGLPVTARRGTAFYRMRKLVRRNAAAVAAAAAMLTLVIATMIALGVQADRLARERDRARQATNLLSGLLGELEPTETRGSVVTAREILDGATARIRTELSGEPRLQAELFDVVAKVYQHRGLFRDAARLFQDALALRQQVLGPDHLEVATSQLNLAILRYTIGDADTDSLFRPAIATLTDQLGLGDPRLDHAITNHAIALRARGEYAAAESLFYRVVRSDAGATRMPDSRATALTYLGKLLTWKGEYAEAKAMLEEALRLRRALHGERHPVVANIIEAIGELMLARGDLEEAERRFVSAQRIRNTFFESDHADVAAGLLNLGRLSLARGDAAAAERSFRQTLDIYRRDFGEESIDVAKMLGHLAAAQTAAGDLAAADRSFEAAAALWREWPGLANHPHVSDLKIEVAALRVAQGRVGEAETLLREAESILVRAMPTASLRLADVRSRLGAALLLQERFGEARALLIESHSVLEREVGTDHAWTRTATQHLDALTAREAVRPPER